MDSSAHDCEQALNSSASSSLKSNTIPVSSNTSTYNQSSPSNGSGNLAKTEGSSLSDDKEIFSKDEDKEKSNGVAVSTSSSINSALSGSNTNTSFSAIMNNSVTVPMTMGVKTVTSAEDDKESLKKDHSFTKSLSPVDFLSMGTVGNKLIVSGGSVTNGKVGEHNNNTTKMSNTSGVGICNTDAEDSVSFSSASVLGLVSGANNFTHSLNTKASDFCLDNALLGANSNLVKTASNHMHGFSTNSGANPNTITFSSANSSLRTTGNGGMNTNSNIGINTNNIANVSKKGMPTLGAMINNSSTNATSTTTSSLRNNFADVIGNVNSKANTTLTGSINNSKLSNVINEMNINSDGNGNIEGNAANKCLETNLGLQINKDRNTELNIVLNNKGKRGIGGSSENNSTGLTGSSGNMCSDIDIRNSKGNIFPEILTDTNTTNVLNINANTNPNKKQGSNTIKSCLKSGGNMDSLTNGEFNSNALNQDSNNLLNNNANLSILNSNMDVNVNINTKPATNIMANANENLHTNSNAGLNINSGNINTNIQSNTKNNISHAGNISISKSNNTSSNNINTNNNVMINTNANSNSNSNMNSGSGNASIMGGNCFDYMQQQNHIFVFSTQLANKGADAVLSGQYPTIIAYHCTQPATKNFLEDFFLKNSMKMTKLQRENTLNMCNMGFSGGGPGNGLNGMSNSSWLAQMPKLQHKLGGNKSELITNDGDILCWNQNQVRMAMDNGNVDAASAIKMLECVEDNRLGTGKMNLGSGDLNNSVPSLQGVKVPDENLTPQQRQHREEQLAKLKKMNQFLFPETAINEFRSELVGNGMGKMQMDHLPPGMNANNLMNMQIGSALNNKINSSMRNIASTNMSHGKSPGCNQDSICGLVDDVLMASDILGNPDMSVCSSNKNGNMQMTNHPNMGGILNVMGPNMNLLSNMSVNGVPHMINTSSSNMNSNSMSTINTNATTNTQSNDMNCTGSELGGLNDLAGGILNNSPDLMSTFNQNFGAGNENNIITNNQKGMCSDMNQTGSITPIEWSKLQQEFYEERLKMNLSDINVPPCNVPQSFSQTMIRSNQTGISLNPRPNTTGCVTTNVVNSRLVQGPPPPYHTTQRSASVPITTQSPNPTSPNNPTSNLSLPSPRTSGAMGATTNSPNTDISITSSNVLPTNTTTTTTGGTNGNLTMQKNKFQDKNGSVSTSSSNILSNNSSNNRNNNSPRAPTPLQKASPKDLEGSPNMNSLSSVLEHKGTRPSPQLSSPLMMPGNNNSDICGVESNFPNPNMGGFHPGSIGNNSNSANVFKNQTSGLDRQNISHMLAQHGRRTDNIPLNPNNNRGNVNKMANSFDPISSLAQMSQQLTGCAGLGMGQGSSIGSGNNLNDMVGSNISLESLIGSVDPSMDQANVGANPGIGVSGGLQMPFAGNNCHMMGQRMINQKMCAGNMAGFSASNSGMRDGAGNFPGMMPGHRMMNHRMPNNFNNFNVSPNVQVKASTPNTIQYMPVRPQNNNNNNNNNMRVAPSLEFLQRYANPQVMGATSGANNSTGVGPNNNSPHLNSMAPSNDMNKLPNASNVMNSNMNQMGFFGNCNQLNSMGMMEQDEFLKNCGNMIPHDINLQGNMLRGMRPMRQSNNGPNMMSGGGPRMPHNGVINTSISGEQNNIGPFSGNESELMDMNDPNGPLFNNGPNQMFLHKGNNKLIGMGMGNTINHNNSSPVPNNSMAGSEQSRAGQISASIMMGPNGPNLMASSINPNGGNGNMNYKNFGGPSPNDLKYAQQYHSFQQQLYATNNRQQAGNSGGHLNNNNANLSFFNK